MGSVRFGEYSIVEEGWKMKAFDKGWGSAVSGYRWKVRASNED